jgi:hypothetical protein
VLRVAPVVRVPFCARGPLFICLVLHICTCTTEMYCSTVVQYEKRADTTEPLTNEISFNMKDGPIWNRKKENAYHDTTGPPLVTRHMLD